MKKKLVLMVVAGVLCVTAIIGGTLAGFSARTENQAITNVGTKALSVGLRAGENNQLAKAEDTYTASKAAPGSKTAVPYNVTNSGEYDIYVRVVINKYFCTKDGEKIFDEDFQAQLIELGLPDLEESGWILASQDAEEVVLYYTKPLAPGASSTDFLETLSISANANNQYADLQVGFDVKTDAVQVANAAKAMPSEWGVYPEFVKDGNGNDTDVILKIAE